MINVKTKVFYRKDIEAYKKLKNKRKNRTAICSLTKRSKS